MGHPRLFSDMKMKKPPPQQGPTERTLSPSLHLFDIPPPDSPSCVSIEIRNALRSEQENLCPWTFALCSSERYISKPSLFCAPKYLTFFNTTPLPSAPSSRLSFIVASCPPPSVAVTMSPARST